MAKSLLIVESPSKARTIAKYLGNEFSVMATSGHIKNLPEFKLGINIEKKFEPEYVVIEGKNKIIKELKERSKKTDKIYIATDPDREGEAIASHVAEAISNSNKIEIYRVLFNEITKDAVLEGIKNPHSINIKLVEAQKARRILDRFVGFMVSPFLWKIIFKGLSAGRVQSVALRLLSEREAEIQKFSSEKELLGTQIAYANSDEAVEKWAREEGRYTKRGDHVIIPLVAPDFVEQEEEERAVLIEEKSPWELWNEWLFGVVP